MQPGCARQVCLLRCCDVRRADRNAWVAYLSAAKVRPRATLPPSLLVPEHNCSTCLRVHGQCVVNCKLACFLNRPLSLDAPAGSMGECYSGGGAGAHVFSGDLRQVCHSPSTLLLQPSPARAFA